MDRRQLRLRNWPVRDSCTNAYSGIGPRVYEHPKVQEIKSREDQHQFLRRRGTRRGGMILYPNGHPFYPSDRQILPARDGRQHRMTDENYILSISGQQLRMRTWPVRDSSRNAYSDFGPRIHEHPRVLDVKFREDQRKFPLRRDTRSGGSIVHPNANHSSNTGQILPERDRLQHRMREEEYKLVMGRRQLRMRTWPVRDSNRNAESDVRPRVCENPPKEQEIKFNEGLRRREMVNKDIKNPKDHPIDGTARKPVPVQEPNPQGFPSVIDGQQIGEDSRLRDSNSDAESDIRARILEEPSEDHLMESNEFWRSGYRRRLTRIIEDYWALLCTKRKAVRIGSLRIVCVLLLIAVILFKILL
uniref:Uncharacterized protein n=2 Tax=Araneus ventricosus TaxID=182803 RepID=A0A4Y2VNT2_ARAVE|nr:hypothetical protein AVEN_21093-1 [Araneus ventricosus]